jgi:hypothetical protein
VLARLGPIFGGPPLTDVANAVTQVPGQVHCIFRSVWGRFANSMRGECIFQRAPSSPPIKGGPLPLILNNTSRKS